MLKILGNTTENLVPGILHPDDSNFVCVCMLFQQAEADAQPFLTQISKTGSYMTEI